MSKEDDDIFEGSLKTPTGKVRRSMISKETAKNLRVLNEEWLKKIL